MKTCSHRKNLFKRQQISFKCSKNELTLMSVKVRTAVSPIRKGPFFISRCHGANV